MSKPSPDNTMRAGAMGAAIAGVALVALVLIPRPSIPMDPLSILSGAVRLTGDQLALYKSYVSSNLAVDSVYLLAHSVMWLGLAQLVSARSRRLSSLTLTLGLLGAALDFLENELRWAALTTVSSGQTPESWYVAGWQTVFGLSFWSLFLAALFAGVGVARYSRSGNAVAVWSLLGVVAASLTYKIGFLPSFVWLVLWHALCAVLLWKNRASHDI